MEAIYNRHDMCLCG